MKPDAIFAALLGICLATATVLLPDPWSRAAEIAQENAADLRAFLPQTDLIEVRLAEDDALLQVALWNEGGALVYPLPDEFSPLKRELGQSDLTEVTAFLAKIDKPTWTSFDIEGRKLLYCQRTPSTCLIYDRAALAAQLGVKSLGSLDVLTLRIVLGVLSLATFTVLAARLWRRGAGADAHGFELFPDRFCARRNGEDIQLSKRDTKILALLQERAGAVVTRDELYDAAWGRDYMPNSRALDQHIINLRRKLDPDRDRPELIETVRGIGYRFIR